MSFVYSTACVPAAAAESDAEEECVCRVFGAEADAFFCFSQLMGELRDRFIKSLDKTKAGIRTPLHTHATPLLFDSIRP